MRLSTLASGFLGANAYLLSHGGHAFVIDPCCRREIILSALAENGTVLDGILLTHGHFDHMMTVEALKEILNVPVYLGIGDKDFPLDGRKNAFSTFFGAERVFPAPDCLLSDGDLLPLGGDCVRVIATPGHSPGSVCFFAESADPPILLTGDTLFSEGTGRTDLYGGSDAALEDSLKALDSLPKNTVIYPGHGPETTLRLALIPYQ